jgi:hypothetical protein
MLRLGSHRVRYKGRPAVERLLLALRRMVDGGQKRGRTLPELRNVAASAQGSHDVVASAYRRLRAAEAELKEALAACASAYEAEVVHHRRLAGSVYAIVGNDAEALNDLGLQLRTVTRPTRNAKGGPNPADQTTTKTTPPNAPPSAPEVLP